MTQPPQNRPVEEAGQAPPPGFEPPAQWVAPLDWTAPTQWTPQPGSPPPPQWTPPYDLAPPPDSASGSAPPAGAMPPLGQAIPGSAPQARWMPPARQRSRRLVYLLAGLGALLLLVVLAVPTAVLLDRYRDRHSTGAAAVGPAGGRAGVGDPYFPDYGSSGYDAQSYRIAVDFDVKRQVLSGQTTISATATERLTDFYVDLALPASAVEVNGAKAAHRLEKFQDLRITPAEPIAAGARFTVTVTYAGKPATIQRAGVESPWRVSENEWLAAGEPESAAWWYPSNDHPSDPALFEVIARVPRGYQAISVGRLVSRDAASEPDFDTWHWTVGKPAPTYAAFLAIGRFELREGVAEGRPYVYAVSTHHSPADRQALFATLERTPTLVRELETIAGPYPYAEIGGLVPDASMWFAGLETATRPLYDAGAVLNKEFSETLLVHELAHMWFGNRVTLLQWNDVFINEAFASWASWKVIEQIGGISAERAFSDAYQGTKEDPDYWQVRMIDPGPTHLFDTVYTRGPMTLQALSNVLGDQAYGDLVRDWAQDGGTRSLEDFMVTAQASTTTDLTPFFRTWLFDTDAPDETAANGFN